MSANTFGEFFRVTTFGESHGPAMGVVIDGCPAGLELNFEKIRKALNRRRPGSSVWVSARNETDEFEVLSGLYQNKTLGTPLTFIVRNQDARSEDYKAVIEEPRKGHADDVWRLKYGHVDHRGGGRSSGRETLCRVLAGSVASQLLENLNPDLQMLSFAKQIGPYEMNPQEHKELLDGIFSQDQIDLNVGRIGASRLSSMVEGLLIKAKEEGKSYGGTAALLIKGLSPGLGRPVFHKLKADLASAMMGIGATIGFTMGDGANATTAEGSEFHNGEQDIYGGIRGGISTGDPIYFEVLFKPTSSVLDVAKKGRHDPCIVPRALPVIEAMAALVLVDHMLARRLDSL